jgi:hypothetical protein
VVAVCILGIITFLLVQRPKFKKRQKFLLAVYFLLFALGCVGVGIYSPGGFRSIPDNIISINLSAITDQMSQISDTNIPDIYEKFFTRKR